MRRGTKIAFAAVVAVAVLGTATYMLMRNKPADKSAIASQNSNVTSPITAELRCNEVCEVLVDMGSVYYSDIATRAIRLVNLTDDPITLLDYSTTCRCTWLTLPRHAIEPNDYADIELTFDSRGEFGSIGNYLSITTSNPRCEVAVWMCAEIE